MASSERPFWTGLPARILMTVVVIGVLAALMIPTGGQKEKDPDKPNPDDGDPPVTVESGCTRDLRRILGGISPGRLGISTGSADLAVELNRWFSKCGEEFEDEFSQDANLQKQLFDQEIYEGLQEQRYLPGDIEHVRMSLLAREIVTNVTEGIKTDSGKAIALFEYVCNNVILVRDENSAIADLPATPYQSLIWGMGTAEHRAWAVATLLRQIRIDSFVIIPQSDSKKWLLGIPVPEVGVMLFDPELGLPIPVKTQDESPFPQVAATMKTAIDDGELLKQMETADYKYDLTNEMLGDISVKLIGEPSLWANRTAKLQFMITPLKDVLLYDGLGSNALRAGEGQLQRIIDLGEKSNLWDESAVGVWEFPIQQVQSYLAMQEELQNNLRTLEAIFAGPQLLKIDPLTRQIVLDEKTGTTVFAAAKTTLHAVRIEQLTGKHQEALPHFGPILTSYKTNPSALNEEAATFAAYWIGLSQYHTQRLSAAKSSFDRFTSTLRQSQTQLVPINLMQQNAYYWKALTQLRQNDLQDAIQTLKASQADNQSHRDAWLINRWEKIASE